MELRLLGANLSGMLALLSRPQVWLVGGVLMLVLGAPIKLIQVAEALGVFSMTMPYLVIAPLSFAIDVLTLLSCPLLARLIGGVPGVLPWPRALPWVLLAAAWMLVIEFVMLAAGPLGVLEPLNQWRVWSVLRALLLLPLLPVLVRPCADAKIGFGHVARRLSAHAPSWYGGFLLLTLISAIANDMVILAEEAATQFGMLVPPVALTALALAIRAAALLLLFLYAVRAGQVLSFAQASAPGEVFE